jgi:dihydroorotate dehydrogenase
MSASVTVIVAAGTAAPEGSRTVPLSEPNVAWPLAKTVNKHKPENTNNNRLFRIASSKTSIRLVFNNTAS